MKRLFIATLSALALAVSSCSVLQNLNSDHLMEGGAKVVQAMTLSDADIQAYVAQYVAAYDAQNTVLPASNAYVKRLTALCGRLTEVDGVPLNFKVYKTSDVNAFACADGSVRVFGTTGIPTFVILTPEGTIHEVLVGYGEGILRNAIQKALE